MFNSFYVKNFRCFNELQISELGRVNLIAGKNNSGKTALMEAIYLLAGSRQLRTLMRRSFPYRPRTSRDLEDESRSSTSWATVFLNFDRELPIRLVGRTDKLGPKANTPVSLQISNIPEPADIEDETFQDVFDRYYAEFDSDLEVLRFDTTIDERPEDMPLYFLLQNGQIRSARFNMKRIFPSSFLYAREGISPRLTSDRFTALQGSKKLDVLIEGLRIMEDRLTDLRIGTEDGRPSIEAEIGLPELVSLRTLGDGMNRLADLILAMHEVSDGIIFIDEIENGLHHTVHQNVWKVIDEISFSQRIQVFATTHSKEMLRAAHEQFKTNDNQKYEFRFHRLDRKRNSNLIEAITYNKFGMDALAEVNFEFEVRG